MTKKQKNITNEKPQKGSSDARPKSKARKILSTCLVVFEATLMVLILLFTITIMTSSQKDDGSLSKDPVFKLSFMPVLSDSMEPFFNKGDLIIVKAVDDTSTLKVGDVVTFRFYNAGKLAFNTHRIVEIVEGGFRTQGDNVPEAEKETTFELIAAKDVLATYKGRIPGLGDAVEALKTPVVFFLAIITPLIILLLYNIFLIIRLLIRYKVQRAVSAPPAAESGNIELTEEMKQRAIEEYLKSLPKDNTDNKTETKPDETETQENTPETKEVVFEEKPESISETKPKINTAGTKNKATSASDANTKAKSTDASETKPKAKTTSASAAKPKTASAAASETKSKAKSASTAADTKTKTTATSAAKSKAKPAGTSETKPKNKP